MFTQQFSKEVKDDDYIEFIAADGTHYRAGVSILPDFEGEGYVWIVSAPNGDAAATDMYSADSAWVPDWSRIDVRTDGDTAEIQDAANKLLSALIAR